MRIITGVAKGVRLETLDGEATRPTTERVKEAIFSVIQFEITGRRVLELFAGSGQMSLEALSRGALSAVLVDSSKHSGEIMRRNAIKTKMLANSEIIIGDYKDAIKRLGGDRFDLVFIDSPYASKLNNDAVKRVVEADILAPRAIIISENEDSTPAENDKLQIRKHSKYGRTYITVYDFISNNVLYDDQINKKRLV